MLVSVLAIAWLSVLLSDQEIGEAAYDRLVHDRRPTPASIERDLGRMKDAELLNPDSTWQLKRGSYLLGRDRRQAVRELVELVRREPDNIDAWILLTVARRNDARLTSQAVAKIMRLDPLRGDR